jgi:hypothetical protein
MQAIISKEFPYTCAPLAHFLHSCTEHSLRLEKHYKSSSVAYVVIVDGVSCIALSEMQLKQIVAAYKDIVDQETAPNL